MNVPVFRLDFSEDLKRMFADGCAAILESDSLANGPRVREFERTFAEFTGCSDAVAVGSGTDALEIALRALNVAGRQVIIPTNTFIATAVAVTRAGGEVVLVDIEEDTFSIDPAQLKAKLTDRTAAVVIVHIGGIISRHIEEIVRRCGQAGVPVIEDAAHAHGSRRGTWKAGAIGRIGCFSFFPTKVMTTGEGGMATTNDPELAAVMRSIRDFGRDPNDSLMCIRDGSNGKMTEFQGLLGSLEMTRVRDRIAARRRLAEEYASRLRDSEFEVILPAGQEDNSFYKVIVRIPPIQAELRRFCASHGVALTGEVYRHPVHKQPVFGHLAEGTFGTADRFAATHICPPLYPELRPEEVAHVCDVLMMMQTQGPLARATSGVLK